MSSDNHEQLVIAPHDCGPVESCTCDNPPLMPAPAKVAVCEHCPHVGGAPFGINVMPNGQPQVTAQLQVCCRCGAALMLYIGVLEQGHGPFVKYGMPSGVVVSRIAIPNGLQRLN